MTEVANQRDLYLLLRPAIYRRRHPRTTGSWDSRPPRTQTESAMAPCRRANKPWTNGSVPPALRVPTPFAPSNEGSNILAGPSLTTLDFGLLRKFLFDEERRLEFRWEAFNLFNTPLFGLPSREASTAGTIGRITTLAADPRVMQFALKLSF